MWVMPFSNVYIHLELYVQVKVSHTIVKYFTSIIIIVVGKNLVWPFCYPGLFIVCFFVNWTQARVIGEEES